MATALDEQLRPRGDAPFSARHPLACRNYIHSVAACSLAASPWTLHSL